MPEMTKNDAAYIALEKEQRLLKRQSSDLYNAYRLVGYDGIGGVHGIREVFDTTNPSHPLLEKVAVAVEELKLYAEDLYAAYKRTAARLQIVTKLIDAYHNGEDLVQARLRLEDE